MPVAAERPCRLRALSGCAWTNPTALHLNPAVLPWSPPLLAPPRPHRPPLLCSPPPPPSRGYRPVVLLPPRPYDRGRIGLAYFGFFFAEWLDLVTAGQVRSLWIKPGYPLIRSAQGRLNLACDHNGMAGLRESGEEGRTQ